MANTPSGRALLVTLPPGARPGDTIQINAPASVAEAINAPESLLAGRPGAISVAEEHRAFPHGAFRAPLGRVAVAAAESLLAGRPGAISVAEEHRAFPHGAFRAPLGRVAGILDARVLCDALEVYYAKHAPDRVATISALVARVYDGPPCLINGIMVSRVLWTAKELCEQIQAQYGETVPVTFKPDGSLEISEEDRLYHEQYEHRRLSASAAPPEAQETHLDPEWVAAREASEVEAERENMVQRWDQKELERALALSRAQHQPAHNAAWLGLDFDEPLSHLDSVSLIQAAQRGDTAAVSWLMRQQIQQVANQPVPLLERDDVSITHTPPSSHTPLEQRTPQTTHPSNNGWPHEP